MVIVPPHTPVLAIPFPPGFTTRIPLGPTITLCVKPYQAAAIRSRYNTCPLDWNPPQDPSTVTNFPLRDWDLQDWLVNYTIQTVPGCADRWRNWRCPPFGPNLGLPNPGAPSFPGRPNPGGPDLPPRVGLPGGNEGPPGHEGECPGGSIQACLLGVGVSASEGLVRCLVSTAAFCALKYPADLVEQDECFKEVVELCDNSVGRPGRIRDAFELLKCVRNCH